MINLPPGDTDGVLGLCLDPHDLAIAKYVAGRAKDLEFNRQLIVRGLLDRATLDQLLLETSIDEQTKSRVAMTISVEFEREKSQGSR